MSDADIMAAAIEKLVDDKVARATRNGTQTVTAEYMGADSEGKVWVMLPGASSATPVRRSSVEASVGDTVSVTVGNGMATLDANLTDKSAGVAGVAKVDAKATVAQETAAEAIDYATQASAAASSAQSSAVIAQASADSAVADAARANEAATQAISDAADAADAADSAQDSANKATYALSDVEKVVGTVNWIAEHGEYALTSDTAVDSSKVYYTRSGSGTQADPYTYSVVANPVDSELSTYFELNVDESIQNFINAHVYLLTDGLYVTMDDDAHRVRIDSDSVDVLDESGSVVASFGVDGVRLGAVGSTYMTVKGDELKLMCSNGAPAIQMKVDEGGASLCHMQFTGDGATTSFHADEPYELSGNHRISSIVTTVDGIADDGAYVQYRHGSSGVTVSGVMFLAAPADGAAIDVYVSIETEAALTIGSRRSGSGSGDNSMVVGFDSEASGYNSAAIGGASHATGESSFAQGLAARATAQSSAGVAGGAAFAHHAFAAGQGVVASSAHQTAIGKYNIEDANGNYAFIIGNGSSASASEKSDAMTVDWSGNVECGAVNGMGAQETDSQSSVPVGNSANVDVASVSLPAGIWMVCGKVQFGNSSTGRRAVKLSTTSQEGNNVLSTVSANAVSGATTQMSTSRLFKLANAATVYLVAWQNSGGSLTCAGDIEATKLG